MHDFLNKLLPLILSLILSQIIYLKLDKKFSLTSKVNLKLRMSQEAKQLVCFCLMAVLIIIVGILNLVIFNISDKLTLIFSGALMGISIPMSNKMKRIQ